MKYFVLCPYGLQTGGPDALHQLVYYLKKVNKDATLVYLDIDKNTFDIPNAYRIYTDSYLCFNELVDDEDNVIIIPEFLSHLTKRFKKSKVYIWWLSVDYNLDKTSFLFKCLLLLTYPIRAFKYKKIGLKRFNYMFKDVLLKKKYNFKKENKNVGHLCASFYAYDYVSKRSKNDCKLFIEPISKRFLDDFNPDLNKEDIILYNPKKCGKFVSEIIKKSSNLKFVPLIGYNQDQLIELYKKAKLYIDFGPFPGAERMPKEAVINGCAIITGKFGASKFYNDVLISDDYKIDATKDNIDLILSKIKYVLENYYDLKDDFKLYRDRVLSLEEEFINSINKI